MKLTNKLIAGFTAMSLVVAAFAPAITSLTVKADNAENMLAYEFAFDNGLTSKTSYSEFMPNASLSREAAARFLVKGADALGADLSSNQACAYTDLAAADQSLVSFINDGCAQGIFKAQAMFSPKANLTREALELTIARIVYGMAEVTAYADDNNVSEYVAARDLLMADEIVKVEVAPKSVSTRLMAALMIYRISMMDNTPINNGTGTVTTGVVAPKPGLAEVSLASTVGTLEVPANASSKKVGSITLTAGANPTTVSSVVISRSGLGSNNGIQVQLAGAGMITDARSMNSTNEATVRFSPALSLTGGQSLSFDVLVSLGGGVNETHTFSVKSINVANGTANGAPVALGTLRTTSYMVSAVSIQNMSVSSPIKAGETNKRIATVDLQPTQRDATINGFTISKKSGEDFNKAFANVKAYHNNVAVGTVVVTNEKIIVSGLNVARIASETASIELRADGIWIGEPKKTQLWIASSTDVSATEKDTNEIMSVSNAWYLPAPTSFTIDLSAVKLTVSKTTSKDETIAPGTSNVTLAEFRVKSDVEFDISNYALSLLASASNPGTVADLSGSVTRSEVQVYVNGDRYDVKASDFSPVSGLVFNKTADRFTVQPGRDTIVRVVWSFLSTAMQPKAYQFKLTLNEGKNISNGQTTILNDSANSNINTISFGTFTITRPTIPSNKTVQDGAAADMLHFNLRAAAENQTLTGVKVTFSGAFAKISDLAEKVGLYRGTDLVKEFSNETDLSAKTLNFDSLSTTLDKDVTVPFVVKVTLKGGEVKNLGTGVELSLAAVSDVMVARAANTLTATTTTSSVSNIKQSYQLSAAVPTVALTTQVAKNTTITFANNTNYDVVISKVEVEMTRNAVNGSYLAWSGSADFRDGTTVLVSHATVPGLAVFNLPVGKEITVGSATETRNIELVDAANTINDTDYTVTVKKVTYKYVDRTDNTKVSSLITEEYTGIAK